MLLVNSKTLFQQFVKDLKLAESPDEINALAFATLNYFGISRTDVISSKPVTLGYSKLVPIISRLNQHEPLQYILNEAWFCGRKFFVDPSVLIPRPETELLVEAAGKMISSKKNISILDIGTGSGCIAISLALDFPNSTVSGIDVSEAALEVASRNARQLNAHVKFTHHDILANSPITQQFDLIISNPPYISVQEKSTLRKNVLDHEPHLALFAAEDDDFIFYRAITKQAKQILKTDGSVAVEINERLSKEVCEIFQEANFQNIKLINDLGGKNRIVLAQIS